VDFTEHVLRQGLKIQINLFVNVWIIGLEKLVNNMFIVTQIHVRTMGFAQTKEIISNANALLIGTENFAIDHRVMKTHVALEIV
jgi:hypothetical protein